MKTVSTYIHPAKSLLKHVIFVLLLLSGLAFELTAQTRFSVTSGNWNDPAVWSTTSGGAGPATPPVAGDVVLIEGGDVITVNIATAACTSIQLGSPTGGGGSGGLLFNAGSQLTVSGFVRLGIIGSTLRYGSLDMTAGGTLICQSLTSSSTTDVFNEGTGTIQLTANNTLPNSDVGNQFAAFNNLTINGGTTTLGKSISIANTLNVNVGTFALAANNVTSVGAISMNGTSITGSGTLTLAGNVTVIAGGTLATISAPINLGAANRTFVINDGAAIPDLTLSGVVSGTGGIIKSGAGSMNLAGLNSYSGATSITTGILRIAQTGGSIPDGSAVTVTSTLDLNGNDEAVGSIAGSGTITSAAGGNMTLTSGGDNTSTTFSGVIQNGSATTVAFVKSGTGTLTLSSANTYTGGTLLNSGTININNANALGATTGAFTIVGGSINNTTAGALTIANYPQAWNGDFTFIGTQNLNLGTGPVTLNANRQVTVTSNTLTVGGILTGGTFNLTKSGAGTLNLGSNAGTLNSLNVNAGTLVSTSGTLNLTGDLTVAGSFTHNNGTVNFNGSSAQSVAGITYNNLTMSGAGQKNASGSVTAVNLNNSSVFDMATNTLSVSGTTTNSGTIRFSGTSNALAIPAGTIEYYGASQNITAGTYQNLIINQSSGEAVLAGDVVVNGTLTLTSRNLNLNGFTLTFGPSASAVSGGPFSSTKMIIATGGSEVRKTFTAPGNFSFPIGDNTGTLEYSPIDINVNAGTFGSPYVGVSVVDAKHPNNASSTQFLSRYWNVTNSGITNATITATYLPVDVNGVEGSIGAAQLNGIFNQSTNGWTKYAALSGNTLTAANAPITSGQLSSFTGITGATPTVSIVGGGVTICTGGSVALSANVTDGDPSVIYTWVPAAGLSATTVSNPTAAPTVTTAYTVSIRDGNGILATSAPSTITVDQNPTTSFAGGDQNFCGTAVTLAANVPGTGTGTWSFAPLGNPDGLPLTAFSNTTQANSTFAGTSGQTYILRWTITSGVCVASMDDVQIIFETTPSVADAGSASITQCNTSTFVMNAMAPLVGSGTWSVFSGSATITNASSATTTITNIVAGTSATLRWTVGNGSCPTTSDDIVLTNTSSAPAANAGLDQSLCNTSNFTLTGNAATPGTGTWSYVSGFAGITITTPGSNVSTVTGLTAGNSVTLRWTISNGVCSSTQDDVVLTHEATPSVADAGLAGITQCNTSTFVMNATVPVVGSGTWTVQTGSATITNASSATTTITNIVAGTSATLRWTVGNGSCPTTFDDIVLTNTSSAPAANAGLDQSLCNTSNFTLTGNAATPGTGTWSYVSGFAGITITTPGSNVSTVTGLTAGNSVTLRWTINNGVCASTQDDVVLTHEATPSVADAGLAGITQCNTSTFVMNATAPLVGSGSWSLVSGSATITNAASATTTITNIVAGTSATLRWTVGNGSCPTTSDDIVLTNTASAPIANAGLDQSLCNTSNFTLTGNAATPGTGTWSYVSGFAGITITTPGSNVSTVTGLTAGNSVTLRWTISNGVCSSTQDDVVLTHEATPSIADAGLASITQCNTSTFVMNATAPLVGSGSWSLVSGSATITNAASATTTITNIVAGTSATLRWTVGNGSCPTTSDDIVLTNTSSAPAANAGLDQSLCNTSNFTLTGNAATPGTGTWSYVSGFAGITITTPGSNVSTVTGLTAGNSVTLRWTISNGVCASTQDDVVLTHEATPSIADAGLASITQCNTSTFVMNATVPVVGSGTWTVQTGSATITNASSATTTITNIVAGTSATLRWTVGNGSCPTTSDDIVLTNTSSAPAANAGLDQSLCNTSNFTLTGNAATPGTGTWSYVSGFAGITITTPGSNVSTVTGLTAGNSVTLRWTISNGVCASTQDDVVLTHEATPSIADAGLASITQCNTSTFVMNATVPVVGSGTWTVQTGSATITNASSATTTITNIVAGTSATLRWTVGNGSCPTTFDDIVLTNSAATPVANAGLDQTLCNTSTFTLAGNVPTPGTGLWVIQSGPGTVTTPGSPTSTVSGVTAGAAPTIVRWTISNGACGSFDEVTLINNVDPFVTLPSDQILCAGLTTTAVTFSGNASQYSWTNDQPSIGLPASGVGNIGAFTALNSTGSPIIATIVITPTTGICTGAPQSFTYTVNPVPVVNSISNIATGTGVVVGPIALATNALGGETFTWSGGSAVGLPDDSGSSPIPSFTTINSGTTPVSSLISVYAAKDGCTGPITNFNITVYPVPGALAGDQNICTGEYSSVLITGTVVGTTFTWTVGTVTGTVSGQGPGSGSVIAQQLTSVAGGVVEYIIIPTANGVSGPPTPVYVGVLPTPFGNSVPAGTHVYCSGSILSITPTSSVVGSTFAWTGDNGSGGSGDITDTPINTTSNPIDVTYTIIPTGPGPTFCIGSPFTIVVTVNPNPSFTATNSTPTICSGLNTNILFNSSTTGHEINVVSVNYNGAGNSGTIIPGTTTFTDGNSLVEALTNSTNAPIDVVYTFNVTTPGSTPVCPLVPVNQTVTVRVYPVPTALASSQSICSGGTSNVVITNPNTVSGTTFSWTLGTVTGSVSGQSAGSGTTISQTLTSAAGGSVQYIITPYANGCAGTPLAPITVTVNPIPVGNSVGAGTHVICSGTSLNIAPTLSVGTGTFTWSGSNGSGGSGNITDTPVNSTNNPINITYTVIPRGPGTTFCTGASFTIVVTVNPNPSFTTTNSTPTICSGLNTNILFNSSTAGHEINVVSVNYNGAGNSGTIIPGTTTFTDGNSLVEALTNSTNAPIDVVYTFNVTTPGSTPVCPLVPVNQTVTVRVYPVPTALASSQSICSGGTSNVVITNPNTVSGTTFSWTLGTVTGSVSGQSAGSGTTISQTLTSAAGGSVQYIITPYANGCAGTPLAPITVTVNPIPVGNSVGAGTHVICSGTSLNIAPTLSVGTGTFTWSGSNGSGGSGNITDTPVNSTNNPINITYTVIPRGPGTTFCTGASFTIVVTVNPNPSFTATNSTPTICSGLNTNILFNSSTTGHEINVVSVNYNGAGNSGTIIPGTTTFTDGNSLVEALTNSTNAPIDVVYTFNVTTPGSTPVCPLVPVNQTVTVRVYPVPSASTLTPRTICSGTTTNISITNPNAVTGTTFTWTVLNPGIGNVTGAMDGSGNLIDQLLTSTDGISTGTVTYRITPLANGCAGSPFDAVVNITPRPVITNPATDFIKDICSGVTLNFTPTASVGTTNFTWTSSVIGTLSGVSASGVGAINDTPVNATNSNAVIIYTITPFVSGCAGNPVNVVVTVRPVPTALASNQIICSGSATSISITNPNAIAGTTYTWTASAINANGSTSPGSGSLISQVLTSADGLTNGTVNYTITPYANGCAGTPIIVTATVKPVPVLTNTPASFSQQICSSETLGFTPTANILGTTFTWASFITGTISPGSVTSTGNGPITDTPVNTGNNPGTVRYTIYPTFNGCLGLPVDLIVTVKPLPSASAPDVTICSGQNAIINILSSPVNVSNTTFMWTALASGNVVGAADGNGSTINQILSTNDALLGTVSYSITPSANGCEGLPTVVTATVNPIATANAGLDFTVCETLTFPATMTIPVSGTIGGSATSGSWTIVSGSGSISASSTSGSTVTATYTVGAGDIASQVILRLTTNDPDLPVGPCSFVSDDLAINVNRRARVTLPSDFTVCEPTSINLSGTLSGSAMSGLWSLVTVSSGTLSASSVTGLIVNASFAPSLADVTTTLTFRLTTNDPDGFGPCTTEAADINVHINESAKVNAGLDFEVCEDQVANLNGSFSGPSTVTVAWDPASGVFGNSNNPITTYALSGTDIAGGGVSLTLRSNDPDGSGPCSVVSDQVFVKINKLPAVFISGLETAYGQNSPIDFLDGFPLGGTFAGPGILAGTNQFNPANAGVGVKVITYTYIDPITGCDNFTTRTTIVNPVTNVDFYVLEDNRPDVNGFPQICANQGQLTLVGIPPVGTPLTTSFFKSLSPTLTPKLINSGSNWFVNTNGLPSGTYVMQYIFTNEFNVTDTVTKDLIVFAAPQAVIDVTDNCIEDAVKFLESSYMTLPNPKDDTIQVYRWFYGEGTNGSTGFTPEPTYEYQTPGTREVTLEVTSNNQCKSTAVKTITIGTLPVADFSQSSYCQGDVTKFVDKSTVSFGMIDSIAWNFGDKDSLLLSVKNTPIPVGTHSSRTSGIWQNPNHQYANFGIREVTLTVKTSAGCTADSTKTIFILDRPNPLVAYPYFNDFELQDSSWVSVIDYELQGNNSSWLYGQPSGDVINSESKAWWTGKNNGSYYNNERSFVIGPCLNIQGIKRPMISLNYWLDTQENFDGVVVQYSTNGGQDWSTLGDAEGRGIEWYNSRNVVGKPGGFNNYAWTGKTNQWKNARFNLEEIQYADRDTVIFRIALGSDATNRDEFDGFAFDDIFIGEKTRNVLVEHFTNDASTPSNTADTYLNNLLADSYNFNLRDSSDFIKIQYHIANPGFDQINVDNPDDPSARRNFHLYGVSQPPFTVMDGILKQYYRTYFDGSYAYITDEELDRRALEDPGFSILVDTTAASSNVIDLQLKYTYIDSVNTLNSPVILHAALVESGVNGNKNYLRKFLLQAAGRYVNKTWTEGTEEAIAVKYTIDVPIAYPDSLSIIAFVQDNNSGKILQTVIKKINRKVGTVVVGVNDDPATAEISGLNIYPNPVSHTLNLQLDNDLHHDYEWKLIDQRGVTVLEGNLNRDLSSPQQVDVSRLAGGIYFMAIQSGEKAVVYRKIAVINRN